MVLVLLLILPVLSDGTGVLAPAGLLSEGAPLTNAPELLPEPNLVELESEVADGETEDCSHIKVCVVPYDPPSNSQTCTSELPAICHDTLQMVARQLNVIKSPDQLVLVEIGQTLELQTVGAGLHDIRQRCTPGSDVYIVDPGAAAYMGGPAEDVHADDEEQVAFLNSI